MENYFHDKFNIAKIMDFYSENNNGRVIFSKLKLKIYSCMKICSRNFGHGLQNTIRQYTLTLKWTYIENICVKFRPLNSKIPH